MWGVGVYLTGSHLGQSPGHRPKLLRLALILQATLISSSVTTTILNGSGAGSFPNGPNEPSCGHSIASAVGAHGPGLALDEQVRSGSIR
jgi:hypothetical protein